MIKTYRLRIYKPDDSIYWTEYANSVDDLEQWLREERTRPYWKIDWRTEIKELDDQGEPVD
jgi:hypothetical protein